MRPKYHAARLEFYEKFHHLWSFELGELFEVPDRTQCFTWFAMCSWDFSVLASCIDDLRFRASQHPPLNAADPYDHAMRHFSACLIRLTRSKHGRIRPTIKAAA
jgi:hypothetical protein